MRIALPITQHTTHEKISEESSVFEEALPFEAVRASTGSASKTVSESNTSSKSKTSEISLKKTNRHQDAIKESRQRQFFFIIVYKED